MRNKLIGLVALLSLITNSSVSAQDASSIAENHLLGDLDGVRTDLEDNGITVESILSHDLISNRSGGDKQQTGNLNKFSLTASVDTAKAGLWDNGTFFIYGLSTSGSKPSAFVGDAQGTDNIEAYSTSKLYEMWYDHAFSDQLSVLFGLHDFNTEFDVLDYAGSLMNSSFGLGKELSQVGISIYPTTSLATRVRYLPTEQSYVQGAIYDGVPGNPNNPKGTHVTLNRDDGIFYAGEVGVVSKEDDAHYKYAVGAWNRTTDFEDYAGNARTSNSGVYSVGEQSLYSEVDPAQGLGAFYQLGFTQGDRNAFDQYLGLGLSYTGLFPCRDADVLAVGIARAHAASDYRALDEDSASAETVFELNYRAEIAPYFSIQPDIQFVKHPGASHSKDSATVIGVRTEVAF